MHQFVKNYFGENNILQIIPLAKAGSDRQYSRITTKEGAFIVCENANIKENASFIYFSNYFRQQQIPVPRIIAVSDDGKSYIQDDLGDFSLLDKVLQQGHTEQVKSYYEKSIYSLVNMQIVAAKDIDYSQCMASSRFGKTAVYMDLQYFKYYFLDLQSFVYDKVALNNEYEKLSLEIEAIKPQHFMFRDFQGRNIMILNEAPHLIDFQGGMQGPLQYDIASLLWQAKAALPNDWKQSLYAYYKSLVKKEIDMDEQVFDSNYAKIVLVRLLQVLGAYGFRGLIQKRAHFLSSIPQGLSNIQQWLALYALPEYPVLYSVIQQLAQPTFIQKFETAKANDDTKLTVRINSFSYKRGIPTDDTGNNGGFVFDCRGILNPGRFEEYKKLTGRDKPVIDFLEMKTRMPEFIAQTQQLVDISIEDYIARDFENLCIHFGCTGGQHRSVYSADSMAKHIQEKYNVKVELHHIIQEEKNWVN